jgi:hypothetical protein
MPIDVAFDHGRFRPNQFRQLDIADVRRAESLDLDPQALEELTAQAAGIPDGFSRQAAQDRGQNAGIADVIAGDGLRGSILRWGRLRPEAILGWLSRDAHQPLRQSGQKVPERIGTSAQACRRQPNGSAHKCSFPVAPRVPSIEAGGNCP